jgi:hypothetical protein
MDDGLGGLLRQRAQEQPEFPFIKCSSDRYLTYAELDEATSPAGRATEIAKNVLAERVLGLPGEPRHDKDLPLREVPRI